MSLSTLRSRARASFLALLLTAAVASAQSVGSWIRQAPLPYPNDARTTAAFGGTRAYMIGSGTNVLESLDGGWSWNPRPMGNGSFNAITFFGPDHGWIVGNHAAPVQFPYRTTDGGATWTPMTNSPAGSYDKVQFVSTTRGWMGGNGVLASTTDGGDTWSIVTLPSPWFNARFDFHDASLGLIAANGGVYRTTNGGASWTLVADDLPDSIDFLDANTVVMARGEFATGPELSRSTDGGLTWHDVDVPGVHLWKPVQVSGHTLVAATGGFDRSDLYRSTDAGLTWTRVHEGTWYPYVKSAFRDAQFGLFFMLGGHVMRTLDGGLTWSQASNGFATLFEDVEMLDASRGVACGYDGTVLVTSNGGTTWTPDRPGFSLSNGGTLRAVTTVAPNFVFCAGEGGTHVKSLDGGRTWSAVPAATLNSWACDFITPDEGWIAGGERRIYRTANGGQSWTLQHAVQGSSEAIYDIEFVDALHGFAVGTFHGVMRTTNGGATWTTVDQGASFPFCRQVDMVDANVGWVSSRADFVGRTTNGGLTWTRQTIPALAGGAEQFIFSLVAIDANECWAATQQGRVYRTTDGGATWLHVETGFHDTYDEWYGMSALPTGDVWLTGIASIVRRVGTLPEAGESYCFGDGSASACPCGNESVPGSRTGCRNSLGLGGAFVARGTPRLSADTVTLSATNLPPAGFALFFQGTSAASTPFGDGLRCVGGSVVRLGTKTVASGSASYPGPGDASVSVRGGATVGATRTYQAWYRNAAPFCTTSTFNLTNGGSILWRP